MPKPTPGSRYTIVKGDTLWDIAGAAYGIPSRWPKIWEANKNTLRSGEPNMIYPGEIIAIPPQPDLEPTPSSDSELLPVYDPKEDLTEDIQIFIQGHRIRCVSSSVIRTMDTGADGFTAVLYWDYEDTIMADLLRPYSYPDAKVYVGGQLVLTGSLYTPEPTVKEDEIFINIEGFTDTVDIVDSNCEPPYERRNITLYKLAYDMVSPYGIKVIDDVGGNEVFAKTTAEPTDTIFEFLAGLAKQRSVLISSSPRGELLITKARTGLKSVGSIGDELPYSNDYSVRFDGRTRFSSYKMLSQRRGSTNTIKAVSIDQNMVRRRLKNIQADDTTTTEIQKAADWERSRGMGDSMSMPFPVSSWYAPDGTLWRENTIVTVTSPRLFIPYGFDFLITQVEYIFSEDGQTAILHLVPPQVYTGEPIEEPWHKYWKYRYSR